MIMRHATPALRLLTLAVSGFAIGIAISISGVTIAATSDSASLDASIASLSVVPMTYDRRTADLEERRIAAEAALAAVIAGDATVVATGLRDASEATLEAQRARILARMLSVRDAIGPLDAATASEIRALDSTATLIELEMAWRDL